MKSRHWIYLGLVVALITIIAVPIYLYNRPLDPPLVLKPSLAAAAAGSNSEPAQAQPVKIAAPADDDEPPEGACGGSGLVNILYLGQNLPQTTFHGADAIRLMFVNYETPSIAILSMPPDILVDITEIEEIDPSTLTYAFWYGKQPPPVGERAAVRRATEIVAQALLDNFDYTTEKYMTMNQPVFGEMVDTLEGVKVIIPVYVDGRPEFKGEFYPPDEDMTGDRALDYVRILQPAGQPPNEWGRFSRQTAVLEGIQAEILLLENLGKLPSLISEFYSLLVTDLKPKELRALYCMIDEVGDDMLMIDVPPEMVDINPDGVMFPRNHLINNLIVDMEKWTWTLEEPELPPVPE